MQTQKLVGYSYPTSINAKRFGFYETGCYHVELMHPIEMMPKYLAGFPTKEEATKYAETLPNEWHSLHLKYNQ